MGTKGNELKKAQLGMAVGTARNKLQKKLMFMFAQKCGMDNCFQCGKKIESIDQLSIEHKIPWLHSDDPIGLFMDLDNIAFSHLSCNIAAGRNKPLPQCPSRGNYANGCRCEPCVELKRKTNRESNRRVRGSDPKNYRQP